MKTRLIITLCSFLAAGAFCQAQLTLVPNGGFENNPQFTSWSRLGDTDIWTISSGIAPDAGSNQAYLDTDFGGTSATTIQNTLGLAANTLSSQGGGGTTSEGSLIYQTFSVGAADLNKYLSLRWNLLRDSPFTATDEHDYAFVTIQKTGGATTFFKLGDLSLATSPSGNTDFSLGTGYNTFNPSSYQFTSTGNYTIGIGLIDIDGAVFGDTVTTALLVDSVGLSQVPEPGEWATVAAGALIGFCAVRRFRQMRPAVVLS